jgi:hypothetical protein
VPIVLIDFIREITLDRMLGTTLVIIVLNHVTKFIEYHYFFSSYYYEFYFVSFSNKLTVKKSLPVYDIMQ